MIVSWTSRGSRSQTSSGPYGLLSRKVAPSSATPSTSIRESRSKLWHATNCACSTRYDERIGRGPKRRCEMVVDPDFFESMTKYACANSGVDSAMIFAEFLLAPTVPSEPSP